MLPSSGSNGASIPALSPCLLDSSAVIYSPVSSQFVPAWLGTWYLAEPYGNVRSTCRPGTGERGTSSEVLRTPSPVSHGATPGLLTSTANSNLVFVPKFKNILENLLRVS